MTASRTLTRDWTCLLRRCNIVTMSITSWSMIFGPGLGIRGPPVDPQTGDPPMSKAVKGMYAERKLAIRFYLGGLASMGVAGILLGWLKFSCRCSPTNANYQTDCQLTDWEPLCFRAPSVMMVILLGWAAFLVHHMVTKTRPRFTFKNTDPAKESSTKSPGTRAPEDKFMIGDGAYDPEPCVQGIRGSAHRRCCRMQRCGNVANWGWRHLRRGGRFR